MTGYDKLKNAAENLKSDAALVKAEEAREMAKVKKTLSIRGLEDVPVSMIPLPFYKIVQPGSTNVTQADKSEAAPGTIFMGDTGVAIPELSFYMLRAKKNVREFTDDYGNMRRVVNMMVLGINETRMTPFILTVPVTSFGNFGRMIAQMKERKAAAAWDYKVTITTEKREEKKDIGGKSQQVKYWVALFELGNEKTDEGTLETLQAAYQEFAASLDRDAERQDEAKSDIPF